MSTGTILKIEWKASNTLQRQEVVETGIRTDSDRSILIDMTTLSREEREAVLSVATYDSWYETGKRVAGYVIKITRTLAIETPDYKQDDASRWYSGKDLEFDHTPTLAEACQIGAAKVAVVARGQTEAKRFEDAKKAEEAEKDKAERAEFARLKAIYLELEPQVKALVASDDLAALEAWKWPQGYHPCFPQYHPFEYDYRFGDFSRRDSLSKLISERKDAIKKAQAEAERADWIEAHGSDHLKRACDAGHDCDRLYWKERAALEYPGFVLDYEKHADWKSRSCPTISALDRRDEILAAHPGVKATIVWLTDEPRATKDYDYYNEFERREAIVVDDPTYKHNLVL